MTMITPSYLGETIEYSSLHACRSTLEDPTSQFQAAADVDVALVRLSDCVAADFEGRTILKIDVQGAETDVLLGAEGLLPQITLVMLEAPLFPQTELKNDLGTLAHLLRPHGFAPVYFCRPGLDYSRFDIPVEHDVIFARVDDGSWLGSLV